ncbi:hypothetical protein GCM10022420_039940 [Streptomyces iranensis]
MGRDVRAAAGLTGGVGSFAAPGGGGADVRGGGEAPDTEECGEGMVRPLGREVFTGGVRAVDQPAAAPMAAGRAVSADQADQEPG